MYVCMNCWHYWTSITVANECVIYVETYQTISENNQEPHIGVKTNYSAYKIYIIRKPLTPSQFSRFSNIPISRSIYRKINNYNRFIVFASQPHFYNKTIFTFTSFNVCTTLGSFSLLLQFQGSTFNSFQNSPVNIMKLTQYID